jgi:hypothetical protein
MNFRLIAISILLSCGLNTKAQQIKTVQDIGAWLGIGVEFELKDKYTFSVLQDIRLFQSFTQVDRAVSELGFAYKINKNFKLASDFRFSLNKKKDESYAKDFRYNMDIRFKTKLLKKFGLSYRLRFQQLFNNALNTDRTLVGELSSNLRNKLAFYFKLDRHKPYISLELFRAIQIYRKPYFNQLRLQLGNEWTNRLGEFDFALSYERELGDNNPLNFFFAKLYYTFNFRRE